MGRIDFSDQSDSVFVDEDIKQKIVLLQRTATTEGDTTSRLKYQLARFLEYLLHAYSRKNISLGGYTSDETARRIFSQFLQYFFNWLIEEKENKVADYASIKNLLLHFLLSPENRLFYNESRPELWIDPRNKETLLLALCRTMDEEALNSFITLLVKTSHALYPSIKAYFLNMNEAGDNVLSVTFLPELIAPGSRLSIQAIVLATAKKLNPEGEKNFWTQFLFQSDEENRTFLIRAFEQKNDRIIEGKIKAILNSINILFTAPNDRLDLIQALFLASDTKNFTALDYAIQHPTVEGGCRLLLKISKPIFEHRESLFETWINSPNLQGNLPILQAAKKENIDCIKTLFIYSFDSFKILGQSPNDYFNQVFLRKNNDNYSLLSVAIATDNVKILRRCLQSLTNYLQDNDVSIPLEALVELFSIKTSSNLSLFDLACHAKDRSILKTLLDYLSFYLQEDIDRLNALIPLRDNQETATYQSFSEIARLSEKQLASLFDYGNNTETSAEIGQVFLSTQISSYTLPICGAATATLLATRSIIQGVCTLNELSETFNQATAYEKSVYPRETDLANTLSFLSSDRDNLDLISFKEANAINLRNLKSHRESTLMEDFNQKIKRSYDDHGARFIEALQFEQLPELPTNAAGELVNNGPMLLDNGQNFILIKDNRLFSSKIYDSQKFFLLKPNLKINKLKLFIETYFGKNYKIYALTEPLLETYLPFFRNLQLDVTSDTTFLEGKLAGMTRENIQRFFLINDSVIGINDLRSEAVFFEKFDAESNKISFISKAFPKIFFYLTLEEKNAFRRLLLRRKVLIDVKAVTLKNERDHLLAYGNKIIALLRSKENLEEITPANLLKITVETYQATDAFKLLFNSDETIDVISAFDHFNTFVIKTKSIYFKTSLQLSVLLLPGAIRSINQGNPGELAIPLAEIAGDVSLRKLLLVLIHHPTIQRLATGTFAEKALQVLDAKLDFLPIVGPLLSFYGITSAIQGLMKSTMANTERRYHAMSLAVHLTTLSYLGLEMTTPMPFFLTLSVYSALSASQVLIEGEYLHEQLHLTDDRYTPKELKRSFELGLSIADKAIDLIKLQRIFLEKILKNLVKDTKKERFHLVALIVPDCKIGEALFPNKVDLVTLNIPKKLSIQWEFTAAERLCEKKDGLYINNTKIDYSLIASNRDSSCYLGTKTVTPIQIIIDSEAAVAGLFLDKLASHESHTKKAMLMLVDTQVVQNFSVYVDVDKFLSAIKLDSPKVCTRKLVCGSKQFDELSKLIVQIGQFYKVENENLLEKISVTIEVNRTQESLETSFFNEVEFNLLDTKNLRIATQGIYRKKLNFLEKNISLSFKDNTLFNADGFLVVLNKTQDLTLVLAESSSNFWGSFRPSADKKIAIPILRGRSPEQLARFDARECENYSIGLAAYSEYIDKNIHVVVFSNFPTPILYLDRCTDSLPVLKLARSINELKDILIKSSVTALFQFFDYTKKNTAAINLSLLNASEKISVYGEYLFDNRAHPATMTIYPVNHKLKLSLELDFLHLKSARKMNLALLALLAVLETKDFEKITLLKVLDEKKNTVKLNHYYFYESYSSYELPVINGNFERYILKEMLHHWVLKLQHKNSPDITEVWLSENIDTINLQGVIYEINYLNLKLYALSNSWGSQYPIDASQLIAPIKINQSIPGLSISQEANNILHIGDKKLANYTEKTQLKLIYPPGLIPLYILLHSNLNLVSQANNKTGVQNFLHSPLRIETKSAWTEALEKGSIEPKRWFLNQVLGVVSIGGTLVIVIGGGIITYRFFRPHPSNPPQATLAAVTALVTLFPFLKRAQASPSNKKASHDLDTYPYTLTNESGKAAVRKTALETKVDCGEIVKWSPSQNDARFSCDSVLDNSFKHKRAKNFLGPKLQFFSANQKKYLASRITHSVPPPIRSKSPLEIGNKQQNPDKGSEILINRIEMGPRAGICIKWFFGYLLGKQSFAKRITQAEVCKVASEENARIALDLDNAACNLAKDQEKYGDRRFSFIHRVIR